jgi:DNA-binding HxlR family transcriptional regulator
VSVGVCAGTGTGSVLPPVAVRGDDEVVTSHADYCPIAIGADVLGDRWTPLVIRELMLGAEGFNEIHRGVPRMSRTLLAQRLRTLERRGLVRREAAARGLAGRYTLTAAGQGLTPIVWAMGTWAAEWVFGDPADDECDGLTLLWRMYQKAVPDRLPKERTVVHVLLHGPGAAQGWLDVDDGVMTVCRDDPGYDVHLAVEGSTPQMQRWLMGMVGFDRLLADGHARTVGPSRLARAFPTWFATGHFAEALQRGQRRREDVASA